MTSRKLTKSLSIESIPLLTSNQTATSQKYSISKSGSFSSSTKSIVPVEEHDLAGLSKWQAIIHIVKGSIGTGVIALPSVLRYSGVLLGSLAILIISMIAMYSARLLLRVIRDVRSNSSTYIPNLDYEKTVKLCFENSNYRFRGYAWMHRVLLISLFSGQIGVLSSYQIFVAENTKSLLDHYIAPVSLWIYQIALFFFLCPLLFIKTLNKLSYVIQLANVLMVSSLIIAVVYCLQDPIPFGQLDLVKLSDATPLFFGIVIFSFESMNLMNPIENHLREKSDMLATCGVLNVATLIVLVIYLLIGICGYLKFGDSIESSLILSIPLYPWYYLLCKPFYIVSILISYTLQGYVLFGVIWKKSHGWFHSSCSRKMGGFTIRVGIVLTTTVLSVAIPHFDLLISLVGAFAGASLAFIFPPICYSVVILSKTENGSLRLKLFVNAMIFIIGIVGFTLGTYSGIVNIIRTFANDHKNISTS